MSPERVETDDAQNGSLFNINHNEFGAGAVGHEGTLARFARRKKQALVRVNPLTEEPARDEHGFCIRVSPLLDGLRYGADFSQTEDNEFGELICEIISDSPFQVRLAALCSYVS